MPLNPFARRSGVRFVSQTSAADCGHACVCMLLDSLGIRMPMLALAARYPVSQRGMSAKEMLDVLRMCGARPRALRATDASVNALRHARLPVIVHLRQEHFVVVTQVDDADVVLLDPASGERRLPHAEFVEAWSGAFIGAERAPAGEASAPRAPLRPLLAEFMRENGPLWGLLFGVAVVAAGTTVALPWLLARAITVLSYEVQNFVHMLGIAMVLLSLSYVLAHWMRSRIALMIQLRLDRKLTSRLVERLLQLPLRVFALLPTGDLLARVNAVAGVRDFLSARVTGLILDVVVFVTATTVLATQAPHIALMFLAMCALSTGILLVCWPRFRRLTEREIVAYSGYQSALSEALNAGVDVKVNRKEAVFAERVVDRFAAHQEIIDRKGRLHAVFEAVYAYQGQVVPFASVLGFFVLFPQVDLPTTTAFFAYFLLGLTGPSVRTMQTFFMQLVVVHLNADRIESIQGLVGLAETARPTADSEEWTRPSQVTLEDVGFSYLGTGQPVIEGFSAGFDERALNVIVGPSGCGKSTVLKLIGGLVLPDRGRITVRVRGERSDRASPALVAYLNQHPAVFSGTVAENICLFEKDPDVGRIEACARAACIHDEIVTWPLGYAMPMASGGQTLSAGQCQRIALARLLYSNSPVMLLDEFTSDIDAETEARIVEHLRAWPALKIVVTHRTQWIAAGDRVHRMGGPLAASSTVPAQAEPAPAVA